jgi:predicted MFS family arabinose efflux permease
MGNVLSMLLWMFAEDFSLFLLSRIVGGLTEGNVQMSIAIISDVTAKEERSKAMVIA